MEDGKEGSDSAPTPSKMEETCSRHAGQPFSGRCITCNKNICTICRNTLHKRHEFLSLENSAILLKEKVMKQIELYQIRLREHRADIKEANRVMQHMKKNVASCMNVINNRYKFLLEEVEGRRDEIINTLNEEYEKELESVVSEISVLTTRNKELAEVISDIKDLISEKEGRNIFQEADHVEKLLEIGDLKSSMSRKPLAQRAPTFSLEYDDDFIKDLPLFGDISKIHSELTFATPKMAGSSTSSLKSELEGTFVLSWGGNRFGQLGLGSNNLQTEPTKVSFPAAIKIIAMATGALHVLALSADGKVFSWGENESGQLGLGDLVIHSEPCEVVKGLPRKNLALIVKIAAGEYDSYASANDGCIYAWGESAWRISKSRKQRITSRPICYEEHKGLKIKKLVAGDDFSAFLSGPDDGVVYSQLHDGENDGKFRKISSIKNILDISCGSHHICCLTSNGSIFAWGSNNEGQLGIGNYSTGHTPVMVNSLLDDNRRPVPVEGIECGRSHTIATTKSGQIYCWGSNQFHELGMEEGENAPTPVRMRFFEGKHVISGSGGFGYHSFALTKKFLYSWGWNNEGQLGIGTTEDTTIPEIVSSLDEYIVLSVRSGVDFSVALVS